MCKGLDAATRPLPELLSTTYPATLRRAATDAEAATLVTEWFRAKVGQILGLQEEDVDTNRPVHSYGIDSLVAINLKNWYATELGANVQVFSLLGNNSMGEVAKEAAKSSKFRS